MVQTEREGISDKDERGAARLCGRASVTGSADRVKQQRHEALLAASVWKEGKWCVSQCLEIDVAGQGETEAEALSNLKEVD